MIKAECSEGRVKVEMAGAFVEILAETCTMLNSIYDGVPEHLREAFAREIHQNTAPGGLCWMTKERLPGEELRDNSEFIVMIKGAANATTLLFDGEAWVDENGDPYNVTHWMPLPEPPEK